MKMNRDSVLWLYPQLKYPQLSVLILVSVTRKMTRPRVFHVSVGMSWGPEMISLKLTSVYIPPSLQGSPLFISLLIVRAISSLIIHLVVIIYFPLLSATTTPQTPGYLSKAF